MHQQHAIYQNYVKAETKNNVEPVEILKGDDAVWSVLKSNDVNFREPYSTSTRFWDNDARTKVFKLADGRIAEFATDNTAFRTPLLAIFASHDDWFGYRKPMGMFHYFNG